MRRMTTLGVSLVLAMGLTTGCKKKENKDAPAPKVTTPTPTPTPEPKKELTQADKLKIFDECWAAFDGGDTEKFVNCYADDGVFTMVDSVPPMEAKGHEAIKATAGAFKTAFPDLKHDILFVAINGNQIGSFFHATGTNSGEFMGMPATNKKVSLLAAQVVTLNDEGKVVSDNHYLDGPTMMAQMGVMPNPMAATAEGLVVPTEKVRLEAKDDDAEKANLEWLKGTEEAMKKHDVDALAAFYADDATFRYMGDAKVVKGMKDIKKGMAEWMGMSKDMTNELKTSFAAGDWIVLETKSSGTMAMDVPGMPVKTKGKKFEQQYVEFMQIADGKMKTHYIFPNGTKWAADMGMMPDPAAAPAEKAPAK